MRNSSDDEDCIGLACSIFDILWSLNQNMLLLRQKTEFLECSKVKIVSEGTHFINQVGELYILVYLRRKCCFKSLYIHVENKDNKFVIPWR